VNIKKYDRSPAKKIPTISPATATLAILARSRMQMEFPSEYVLNKLGDILKEENPWPDT
jgi:hypothetical protein